MAQEVDDMRPAYPAQKQGPHAPGAGARQAKSLFLLVTFGATVISLIGGLLFTALMLRHMRQTEQRYKHLIDTANDAILVIDAETGIVLEANARSSAFLGRPTRKIVGARAQRLFWRAIVKRTTGC